MRLEFQGPFRIACIIEQRDGLPHRTPYSPGDDLSALPKDIRAAIEAEWTPEVIAAYREATRDTSEPERRIVDRRTIIERLAAVGLLDEAEAALLAAPALIRWKWNTAGEGVYFDDPETVGFLKAIGADVELILAL